MSPMIKQINILDIIEMYGEDSCKEILSTFICPLNMDVADFIHNKAIEFAKQRIAITFLVFRLYSDTARKFSVSGGDLLDLACQNIKKVQHIMGGKTTYIECASNPKLHDFYALHEFVPFGEREREKDELSESQMLVQMLRYFKSKYNVRFWKMLN